MIKKITFNECPRPQLVRENWVSLNGVWDFCLDFDNKVWPRVKPFEKEYEINVPFCYLTKASGINIQQRCDCVWYQKVININKQEGKRYILHFEGADYCVRLTVNGAFVGEDTGAYHRMSFDITDYVVPGDNVLLVNVLDDQSTFKPRGKQRWTNESFECWYKETTGIYKEVWLETVNETYIQDVKITPNSDSRLIDFVFNIVGDCKNYKLKVELLDDGKLVDSISANVKHNSVSLRMSIYDDIKLWSQDNPELYDLKFELIRNGTSDVCTSYVGFRSIKVKDGKVLINNKPIYQKLVLDQGYWKDSELTPPSNEALYKDIELMKAFGFNGCRKHEKFEDERFFYYCDVCGYYLWCEMPSMLDNNPTSRIIFEREWMLEMKQAYNHPSVIIWTIFNESWGINHVYENKDVQDFVNNMYKITKEFDPTRLAITNDGWEHTNSDLITFHHYEQDGEKLHSYFDTKEKCFGATYINHARGAFAKGYSYNEQPLLLSEFGGTAFNDDCKTNWGYGKCVNSKEEYAERLIGMFKGLQSIPFLEGYCFTQVTDVQQEINGLLTEDRKPKIEPSIIKAVQDFRN